MNRFIGGYFEGKEMPFNDYVGEVFYAANLGDNYKTPYFRTTVEYEGITYTFWVVEGLSEEEVSKKINKYFVKN